MSIPSLLVSVQGYDVAHLSYIGRSVGGEGRGARDSE